MANRQIRAANPAEAAELTEIAHAAKRYWGYEEKLIQLWLRDLTVSPEFVSTHPVYCAVERSQILGFYALSGQGERYELEHMWVDPSHIGAGVGTTLFEHAVHTVASMGGSVLMIASDPHAEGFYLRMGATRVRRVPSTPQGRTLPLLKFAVTW